jgi:curved DNA-binding protein
MRDFYATLGITRSATKDEIRKAYRKLARELHPDRNPGNQAAEERFKEVARAYEVLTNESKRTLYDEFGEAGLREGFDPQSYRQYQAWQRSPGSSRGQHPDAFNIEDLLQNSGMGDVFRNRRPAAPRGRDLEATLEISFVDALRGTERELRFTAGGARDITARIPAGVRHGGKVRLRGQGAPGRRGGAAGDLLLTVSVAPHPHFWREDEDLHLNLPVTFGEAWQGAKVQVPTLDGPVAVRVPAGSSSGTKLRLRGKGARRGTDVGDLIVHVQIAVPPGPPEMERTAHELEASYPDLRADLEL